MTRVSQPGIAFAVGVTLFLAFLLLGFLTSYPPSDAGPHLWMVAMAKAVIVAAVGSSAIVGFLALCVAGIWVWLRTLVAFGRVPSWSLGWILDSEALSEEGRAARMWLLRVYGVIALLGVAAHVLQRLDVL